MPFCSVEDSGDVTRLDTGKLTVISRDQDKAFFPSNLEIRWRHDGMLQFWRPGDVDHLNLGGTVRSLDGFNRDARLDGVHVAGMESPDAHALMWHAWNMCEVDPWYLQQSECETGIYDLHQTVKYDPGRVLVRTANHVRDQYRYAPGILSRSGYFFLNDSDSAVLAEDDFPVERERRGTQDWYFFCYNDDFRMALRDWRLLAGAAPLPPPEVFGLIFSRWPAYDEAEAHTIVERFRDEGIPLGVLVLDMEWHKKGWCNWDWNTDKYPDPEAFIRWCHERDTLVTLNVHPLHVRADDLHFDDYVAAAGTGDRVVSRVDGDDAYEKVDVDIGDRRQAKTFMRVCQEPVVAQGIDFWWVDGTQGTVNGSSDQLVTNKLFFENVRRDGARGMLLSRYGGLGSHRYGVFFTGDTYVQWEVLSAQCEFNIRAGHVGMGYISHDIGGFSHPATPLIDPILYIRWLQFGVFNPVLRFHSCPGAGSRQPWDYGETNAAIAKRWLAFRNSLLPYIYSAAYRHNATGVPPVRGIFFDYPREEQAYRFDQFMFGDAVLVAPILSADNHRRVYLPTGNWFEYATGKRMEGAQECDVIAGLDDVPLYARAGAVVTLAGDGCTPSGVVENLRLEAFCGADGVAELYEDDGRSDGSFESGWRGVTKITLRDGTDAVELGSELSSGELPIGASRRIEVCLVTLRVPFEVRFQGHLLDRSQWRFDAARSRCVISLGARAASETWNLEIRLADEGGEHA